jgi:tellurite resistance protein TerC
VITSIGTPALWAGFVLLVVLFLALDLGVFHRRDEPITTRNALAWTGIWVAVSLAFNAGVAHWFGGERAAEFLTGYLIEKSLSVDNLFVFLVIFSTLAIPPRFQHRVLFWGILTAMGLRAAMILAGTALLSRFHWLIYVFGAFLALTGLRLVSSREVEEPHPERSALFRLVRRVVPATARVDGHRFLLREGGRWVATPLLVALVLVEISDVVFALDSIPAIFGITLDPFIVFTSNIFAILGLRSLYFALSSAIGRFSRLRQGLALVLIFIGAKMLVAPWFAIGQGASLGVVAGLLGGAVLASGVWPSGRPGPPGGGAGAPLS